MGRWNVLAGTGLIAALVIAGPLTAGAQGRTSDVSSSVSQSDTDTPPPGPALELDASRFEFSLGSYLGRPGGYIRASENGLRGNRLRLNDDLGVRVSEAADGAVAFHLTPKDAVRLSFLYYFLRGQGLLDRSIVFDGDEYRNPDHVTISADFYRLALAYERTAVVPGGFLTGSLGLSYLHLDPELTSHPTLGPSHSKREPFYRQALPVPVVGLRFDIPLGGGFGARASVGGGGLPLVNSGRREGGTVRFEQAQADAAMALTYAFTKNLLLDVGPRLSYFFQHEKSHEEDNAFRFVDYGLRAGLSLKF